MVTWVSVCSWYVASWANCMQTAKAAAKWKHKLFFTQLSLAIFKFIDITCSNKVTILLNDWELGLAEAIGERERKPAREALNHLHKFATELQMEPISDGIREIKVRETEW